MTKLKINLGSIIVTMGAVFFLLPSFTFAATLSLSPSGISIKEGDTVTEVVTVSSSDQSINAISGELQFPTNALEIVSISKLNSVLTLWVEEPSFVNSEGTVRFSGVVPNPGYQGSGKRVFSITFRAKKTGNATISFTSSSVLANDGSGTNILTDARSATLSITATSEDNAPIDQPKETPKTATQSGAGPVITSPTHPTEDTWYPQANAVFNWTTNTDIEAVRIGYDKKRDGNPSVEYGAEVTHKELTLKDGTWYFHVQQKRNGTWGTVSTYRIRIDTESPTQLIVSIPSGATSTDAHPEVRIRATDELSGVDHFEVALNGSRLPDLVPDAAAKNFFLNIEDPGAQKLHVTAFDAAGNKAASDTVFTTLGFDRPTLDPIEDLEKGKLLTVTGKAKSGTRVTVYLKGAQTLDASASTTKDGTFSVTFSSPLPIGSFSAVAQAKGNDNTISYRSDPISFKVFRPSVLSLRSSIFPWILALLLLILNFMQWFKGTKTAAVDPMNKNIGALYKTHLLLRKEFSKLTEVVVEEISALERVTTKRTLTVEEKRIIKKLKKMIEQAESAIEKQIDTIE